MLVGTNYVLKGEPCLGLYELNYQAPDNSGFHRYQIIHVIRDDHPAEYRKDLGSSKKFKGIDQFRIPGGVIDEQTSKIYIEHTVTELQDIANHMRVKGRWDKRELSGANKIRE